jgi:hypothetical protein
MATLVLTSPVELAPAGRDWTTPLIVFTPVICATLLAKFAMPPLGAHGIGLVVPLTFTALLVGLASGRMQLVPRRLLLYLIMLSVLGLMQVLRAESFSISSLALMAALGVAYVFAARDGKMDAEQALRYFGDLTFVIAMLGIGQFLLQFVAGNGAVFPIETYVPEAARTQGFHNIAPLYWGSDIFRANGVVMLEPSELSQVCALGLISELAGRSRAVRLAIYAGAMIVSYSGTGLIVLAASLPLYAVLYRRWNLLLPGLVIVGIAALFAGPLHLEVLVHRTSEFGSPGSSGFARFVGWRDLFDDQLWSSTTYALFGHGAGSFFEAASRYSAAEMSYSKIIFEFGVLGALVYFTFIFYCLFSTDAPFIVRFAVAVCYLMNGAYAPSVTGFALSLLLWPNARRARRFEQRPAGAVA